MEDVSKTTTIYANIYELKMHGQSNIYVGVFWENNYDA